jgi:hypothetical protein
MAWVALVLVTLVVAAVVLGGCGVGGGMLMLVILNGFSESQARPVLLGYAALVLVISILVTSAANWLVVRQWFADANLPGWAVAAPGLALAVLVGIYLWTILTR